MNKNLIQNAKSYVFRLLGYDGHKRLSILCKGSCSEVSRLLAIWFRNELPKADIYIAKGKIKNLFHDILIVKTNDGIFIVDPTLWQFFKNKKTILIGRADNMNETLKIVAKIYTGKWKISEQVTNYSKTEINRLKNIVARQIKSL